MTDESEVLALLAVQANDEGLWFDAQTAAEAYLQGALRQLHAFIEDEPAISVIEEASKIYSDPDNFAKIDPFIRKQISFMILSKIFEHLVVPAIDRVRELDREHS